MTRKYLDDLGVTDRHDLWGASDKRQLQWQEERAKYGFDERETWALDHTFYCWLYERIMWMLEYAPIDLSYHEFDYNGTILTLEQCMNLILKGCKINLTKADTHWTEEDKVKIKDVQYLFALILDSLWW